MFTAPVLPARARRFPFFSFKVDPSSYWLCSQKDLLCDNIALLIFFVGRILRNGFLARNSILPTSALIYSEVINFPFVGNFTTLCSILLCLSIKLCH